jgi:hypothetical protein
MLSLEQIVSFYPEQLRIYKRNLSKTKPSYDFLKEKMKIKNGNNLLEIKAALLRKYQGLNPKKLIEEVRPLLFHPEDAERILLFPEFIQQKMP